MSVSTPDELPHPLDGVEREHFRIEDDVAAAWAMRKLRALARKQRDNVLLAEQETARIVDWVAAVNGPLQDDVDFFTGLLRDYAMRCRANPDDGRKTLSLPTGKVTTRTAGPRLVVHERDQFIAWALASAPHLLRIKHEPDMTAIRDEMVAVEDVCWRPAVTTDGEVVPGLGVEPGSVSVAVNPTLD